MYKNGKQGSYKPVACSLYDQYEIWAMHKAVLQITYQDKVIEASIKTLKVIDKVEYAILSNDLQIRLDDIVKVTEVK
ncbi:hypothetical protein EI427_13150 [Flammeovirga pectinis]|uniref:Uncharacterized protein n=1 Tax=Flammeovirga pectinis TaxID=2494373 RepID=A0A3S9P4Y4_9BACT|nr:Rho-binding antiterminator [Flammeovirga pectinis]AZQ63152.1 hypothetical protein EI427_13150 [Flammeovirga pectinis]